MFKILVAEDNEDFNKNVCNFLRRNGYDAVVCLSASEALDVMYSSSFDMLISDIMMPDVDGFELAQKVRAHNENVPILFMSAKDDIASKQRGYNIGIDDYITKPFNLEELLLRVGALLRRAKIAESNELVVGNLSLNKEEHSATKNGVEFPLTVREFDILFKLLSYPKKTFTRAQLINEFWDDSYSTNPRVVDVYITKLREKFADCDGFEIVTIHGLGYKAVLK